MAEAGYTHLEVMVTKDPASQDPARMASLARTTASRSARSTRPRLLADRGRSGAPTRSAKIYRSIEVAEEAEVPLW